MPVTLPQYSFGKKPPKESAGGGILSAAISGAAKQKSNRLRQALEALEKARMENQIASSQGLQFLKRGLPEIDKAFAGAGANLAIGAGSAKARIGQAGAQNLAIGKQALAGRGLGNTSLATSVGRGANADMQTQSSAIDEQVASRMAQLSLGKQQARQQTFGGIADLLSSYGVSNANILQSKASTLGQVQQRRRRGLGSFLGAVAPIVGAVWGGPAGAALGTGLTGGNNLSGGDQQSGWGTGHNWGYGG